MIRVPTEQAERFELALLGRLGIDPSIVSEVQTIDHGDDLAEVTLMAHLPAAEVRAIFNGAGHD